MKNKKSIDVTTIFFVALMTVFLILIMNVVLYCSFELPNSISFSLLKKFNLIALIGFVFALLIFVRFKLVAIGILVASVILAFSITTNDAANLFIANNKYEWLMFKSENDCKLVSKGTRFLMFNVVPNNGWQCSDGIVYYNQYSE